MADENNVNEKPKKRKFSKLKYIIAFIFLKYNYSKNGIKNS